VWDGRSIEKEEKREPPSEEIAKYEEVAKEEAPSLYF